MKMHSGAMKVTCVERNCVCVCASARERRAIHYMFVLLQTVIVHNLSYSSFLPKVHQHVYCRYILSSLRICVDIVFVSLFAYRICTIGFLRTMQYVENVPSHLYRSSVVFWSVDPVLVYNTSMYMYY